MNKIVEEEEKSQVKSVHELQQMQKMLQKSMSQYEKKADYGNAEVFRKRWEQCKEQLLNRKANDLRKKQEQELRNLMKSREQQLNNFTKEWTSEMINFQDEIKKMKKDMEKRHKQQVKNLREQLDIQLPKKVKESNQLLNLRKMEEHASKQKNFVEAHRIQTKANSLFDKELNQWLDNRNKRIQQAVKNLNNKHDAQFLNFNRRLQDRNENDEGELFQGEVSINQKFDNLLKEMKARHEREMLSIYGELRNSGGRFPEKRQKQFVIE